MHRTGVSLAMVVFSQMAFPIWGQGSFQNLGFESANVPDTPPGTFGGMVSSLDALPGWTVYEGTNRVNDMWHNAVTIGSASVIMLGPNWPQSDVFDGNYSVKLVSGFDPTFPNNASSIAQTGQIPITTRSMIFFARVANLEVTFAGNVLPSYQLGSTANYDVYGTDVTAFAGLNGELRFAAFPFTPNGFGGAYLDAISFSDQPIPEPSVQGLLAFGAFLLGRRFRWTRR